jgi:DNA polymerase III subunit epsilon
MSGWWTGAALGFDIESDGKIPTEARIITMATVLVTPDNPAQPIEVMVQPERDIPQEAINVHGITTEHAREHGQLRELGIAQVALTIAELASVEVPYVGHNASFDLTLLDREMRRLGIGWLTTQRNTGLVEMYFSAGYGNEGVDLDGAPEPLAVFPVIDTYVLDKAVDKYRPGKRQLSFVAAHYGVPMAEGAAHGATADVFASLRIAYKIAKRSRMTDDQLISIYRDRREPAKVAQAFQRIGSHSPAELHQSQRLMALEQAESLRDHFVRTGNTEAAQTVDGRWPIRPLDENENIETVSTTLI